MDIRILFGHHIMIIEQKNTLSLIMDRSVCIKNEMFDLMTTAGSQLTTIESYIVPVVSIFRFKNSWMSWAQEEEPNSTDYIEIFVRSHGRPLVIPTSMESRILETVPYFVSSGFPLTKYYLIDPVEHVVDVLFANEKNEINFEISHQSENLISGFSDDFIC